MESAAAQLGIKANYEIDIDSLPSIKQLVIEGAGYTVLPYAAVHDEVARGLFTTSRIVEPDFYRPLGMAVRPNGILSIASNKLSSLIQTELSDLLAKGNWMGRVIAESPMRPATGTGLCREPAEKPQEPSLRPAL